MRQLVNCLLIVVLVSLPVGGAQVPRPAPALSFMVPGGKQVNLQNYRGNVVALEFLLTTCPHCQKTSGVIERFYKEYGKKGFQPLGVAIDPGAAKVVPDFVRKFGLTYPVGYADHSVAVSFLQHSSVVTMMMPQLVLIDRKGTIRAQYPGTDNFFRNEEANMRKLLDMLLAE